MQSPPVSAGHERAVNHHMRGAPLQYNSTRSFAGVYANVTGQVQQEQQQPPSFAARSHPHRFIPEDIHSSIPIASHKALPELPPINTTGEATLGNARVHIVADKVPATGSKGEIRRLVPVHIM